MKLSNLARRYGALSVAATAVVLVAGCGGTKTDVSAGVKDINDSVLAAQGAKLDCPKQVDGGEGKTFDCKLQNADGSKTENVTLKVTKQGKDLAVDLADENQFKTALAKVTAG
jgi:hypothetical protein